MRRLLRLLSVGALTAAAAACGGGGGGSPSSTGGGGGGGGGTVVTDSATIQTNLDRINELRASVGAGPLVLDVQISDFATDGSQQLMSDHSPHAHFQQAASSGTLF